MFGRHLKNEYKNQLCCVYDTDGNIIGKQYTSLNNPFITMGGVIVLMVYLTALILHKLFPLFGLNLCDTTIAMIIWVSFVASLFIGYSIISESDYKDDVESLN